MRHTKWKRIIFFLLSISFLITALEFLLSEIIAKNIDNAFLQKILVENSNMCCSDFKENYN